MSFPNLIQGHTPHDRLAYLLTQLCNELDATKDDALAEARSLATQAKEIVDGYDKYVVEMSSAPPAIVDMMVEESYKHDWELAHHAGKTQFRLIPEMSAGGYEAVVLQELARLSQARRVLEIGMFTGTTTVALALVPTVEKVTALELEQYLRKVLALDLLAKGGVIVADNVAFRGAPWFPVPEEWYQKSGLKSTEFKQAVDDVQQLGRAMEHFNNSVRCVDTLPLEKSRIKVCLVRPRDDPSLEVVMLLYVKS